MRNRYYGWAVTSNDVVCVVRVCPCARVCVERYDVVIASGEVVRASPTENKELYYALPWSHGTLGFVVALELKLVRSKPFIKLEYLPFNTMESYCKMIRQLSCTDADPPDFVEATIYSREQAVVTVGRFTELPSDPMEQAKVNRLGLWFKPWWYKYVQAVVVQVRYRRTCLVVYPRARPLTTNPFLLQILYGSSSK